MPTRSHRQAIALTGGLTSSLRGDLSVSTRCDTSPKRDGGAAQLALRRSGSTHSAPPWTRRFAAGRVVCSSGPVSARSSPCLFPHAAAAAAGQAADGPAEPLVPRRARRAACAQSPHLVPDGRAGEAPAGALPAVLPRTGPGRECVGGLLARGLDRGGAEEQGDL